MPSLSRADVDKLLAQPSALLRAELAEKVGRDFDNQTLTASEVQIAQDIIRILAADIEATVRANLAQSLRCSNRLPHDVAVRLANDIDHVALPILTNSNLLTPDDLIEVVRGSSPLKQQAIAGRRDLPEVVSDELIAQAHVAAVTALMQNSSAHISESSFGKALDRFSENADLKEGMARRGTLPLTISERLVTLVSDRLKGYLVEHHELSSKVGTDLVLQSRDITTIRLSYGHGERELERLAREMHSHGRLTPFLVLRALCLGDMAFFEAAMAIFAGVPVSNARLLIADDGPNGLKALFDKSALPPRLFPAMRVAVDVVRGVQFDGAEDDLERYRAQVIVRILTQFEQFDEDDLDYLMDKLIGFLGPSSARATVQPSRHPGPA
jgi:uncharacterized protein (DUF2336 family)